MKEHLTGDDVFSELLLARSAFSGAFLVLEGDSDCRVLDPLLDSNASRCIPAHGRANVLAVMTIAESKKFQGVAALVDADFDRIEGRSVAKPNVAVTDDHDLDMTLIRLAFHRVEREYGSREKAKSLCERRGKDQLLTLVLLAAVPVGALRLVSARNGHGLKFEGLSYRKFVDSRSLVADSAELISRVLHLSRSGQSAGALRAEVDMVLSKEPDPWQLCTGHDVLAVCELAFRFAVGTADSKVASPQSLQRAFRLAISTIDIERCGFYGALRKWEVDNAPYRLFPLSAAA